MKFTCPDCKEISSFNVYPDNDEGHFLSDAQRASVVEFVLHFAAGVQRGNHGWHNPSFSSALTNWFQENAPEATRCKNQECRRLCIHPKGQQEGTT